MTTMNPFGSYSFIPWESLCPRCRRKWKEHEMGGKMLDDTATMGFVCSDGKLSLSGSSGEWQEEGEVVDG